MQLLTCSYWGALHVGLVCRGFHNFWKVWCRGSTTTQLAHAMGTLLCVNDMQMSTVLA
jgi:hypothetical protein